MTPPPRRDPAKRVVCSCLEVTEAEIRDAVKRHGLCTVQEIGKCTEAGEGCLSCHPALRRILREESIARLPVNQSARQDSSVSRRI